MSPAEQVRSQIRLAVSQISATTAKLIEISGLSVPTPPRPGPAPTREDMREATARLQKLTERLAGA